MTVPVTRLQSVDTGGLDNFVSRVHCSRTSECSYLSPGGYGGPYPADYVNMDMDMVTEMMSNETI